MTDYRFPANELLKWFGEHQRVLPWRSSSDPYPVWVSEIMLQQTRVETVIPYFLRFLKRFPHVEDLAQADQQQVLKEWEGLGYYSRARNLHQAAKTVVQKYDGVIPSTMDEIRDLKGVGPYTASAILSIAFGKPHAVVDGNVIRVLARYFGIADDIRSQKTRSVIQERADEILDRENPGDFNQALMELGATVCSLSDPQCGRCPLSAGCIAFRTALTGEIPYKSPAKKVPHHHIGVGLIVDDRDRVLIALRPDHVMLGGLWEFPGGKQKEGEPIRTTVSRELKEELGVRVEVLSKCMEFKHAYSHFKITLHAYWCRIRSGNPSPAASRELRWVPVDELKRYPFPKANKILTEKLEKDGIAI